VARRRRFNLHDKIEIVNKTRLFGNSVSSVAREHGIAPSVLFTWRKLMEQGELESMTSEEDVVAVSKMKEMQNRIKSLKLTQERKIPNSN
jgi:transposase